VVPERSTRPRPAALCPGKSCHTVLDFNRLGIAASARLRYRALLAAAANQPAQQIRRRLPPLPPAAAAALQARRVSTDGCFQICANSCQPPGPSCWPNPVASGPASGGAAGGSAWSWGSFKSGGGLLGDLLPRSLGGPGQAAASGEPTADEERLGRGSAGGSASLARRPQAASALGWMGGSCSGPPAPDPSELRSLLP